MYYEILQEIIEQALLFSTPFTSIGIQDEPDNNGLAACVKDPGSMLHVNNGVVCIKDTMLQTHMDKGKINEIAVALSGKHSDQQMLITALSNIHNGLSKLQERPSGTEWEMLSIDTLAPPYYIGLEETVPQQWYYGSLLQVKFYIKGVEAL